MASPRRPPDPPLLLADFFGNSYHQTCLHLYYLVLLILSDDLVARFWLSVAKRLRIMNLFLFIVLLSLFQYVKITLGLPAARAYLEKVVGECAMVLPASHRRQIAERAINDRHVDLVRQKARRYPAKRAPIYSNLSLHAQPFSQVLVDLQNVALQVFWRRLSMRSAIRAIVPREDVDVLVEEHLDVVGVRQVHHLLVEHRIRVADDEAGAVRVKRHVLLIDWLTISPQSNLPTVPFPLTEEHTVKFAAICSFHPVMLRIELRLKNKSKLLDLAKKHSIPAAATCSFLLPPAAAS